MLDTYRLMIFLPAAETLNFSETARQLHISQANVSHHIKMLEEVLAGPLYDQSQTRIRLNDPGLIRHPRAHGLPDEAADLKA